MFPLPQFPLPLPLFPLPQFPLPLPLFPLPQFPLFPPLLPQAYEFWIGDNAIKAFSTTAYHVRRSASDMREDAVDASLSESGRKPFGRKHMYSGPLALRSMSTEVAGMTFSTVSAPSTAPSVPPSVKTMPPSVHEAELQSLPSALGQTLTSELRRIASLRA
ncbi:MAG: hypothetical protein NFCOHLIN_03183 [Gammaproteobacteria bacterium]|nr:hypothetical protein [Gammaproteobacteria bacterium]